jgi:hypothetical protein
MKKYGYIYKITNKINGFIYVGKRTGNGKYFTSSTIIQEEIKNKTFIEENYCKEILIEGYFTREELSRLEKTMISEHNTYRKNNPLGYNLTTGGGHCGNRLGKSPWNKGLKKDTHPSIKKYSESQSETRKNTWIRENHPRYGTKHNEETKKKLSDSRKGKWKGEHSPKSKRIEIDGISYVCLREACEFLKIKQPTLTYRLNSSNFPTYKYL